MRRSRPLLALLALALLVAGCGSSGSSGDEEGARHKLEAAGQKLTDAKSFEVSLLIEGEEEGNDPEQLGCVDLGIDKGKPERLDLRIYDLNCSGGSEGKELIAIGRRAWAASGEGSWTAAKITPKVIHELNDEQTTDLKGLFEAAEDLHESNADDAVEARAAGGEAVSEYSFKAPASAFPYAAGDLGDTDVEFEATIDGQGYLSRLKLHGEAEGAGATVTETYEHIDEDLPIRPPAASEIQGPVRRIDSRDELDALIGASP